MFRQLFEPTCAGVEAGHHDTLRPYDVILEEITDGVLKYTCTE